MISEAARGQLDDKLKVVGLHRRLVSRLVSYRSSALFTFVNDDISSLRVGKGLYRTQNTATGVLSVTRVYIYVQGA